MVGIVVAAIAVVVTACLLTWYMIAVQFDREVTAIELTPWIRWTYPQTTWLDWCDVQRARIRATLPPPKRRLTAIVLGSIVLVVYVPFLFVPSETLTERLWFPSAFAVVFVGICLIGARVGAGAPERRRAFLETVTPEAIFGDEGVFCNGGYLPWRGTTRYLLAAWVDENAPRSVVFRFRKDTAQSIGGGIVDEPVLIPDEAPDAVARDLTVLQAKLVAAVPNARIDLA